MNLWFSFTGLVGICRFLCLALPFLIFHLPGKAYSSEKSGFSSSIKVDSVSVLENNHIIIGWTLVTDVEEGFIEVHRKLDNGLYAVITQVPLDQSSFTDTGINAQNKAYSYYVVARYLNGDNIAVSMEAHQTTWLDIPQADICLKQFLLNWQNYSLTTTAGEPQPLPSPFHKNFVEMSFDGSQFQQVLETGGQVPEALTGADLPGNYCFRIKTQQEDTGITSTSNIRCATVDFLPEPGFLHFRKVSVAEGNDAVNIHLHADNSVPDPAYVIKQEGNSPGEYQVLDTLITSDNDIFYEDNSADPAMGAVYYMVEVLDSCRMSVLQSEQFGTMHLRIDQSTPGINILEWNNYHGWLDAGVESYIVQRKTNDPGGFENLATLTPSTNSFEDDLSFTNPDLLSGSLSYRIMALEAPGNPFGFADTVYSNTVELLSDVEVFVPSAFKPMSQIPENRYFKAFFPFFTPGSFSLVVINRWGTQVFSSTDMHAGWDGNHDGSPAPPGVYSWIITFTDPSGEKNQKRGAVILIR